jgi:hypothetical protein
MQKNNLKPGRNENANRKAPADITVEAHKEADKDMEKDPELNDKPEPGDDLDEGELARFEGEE